uniref:Uncharacterized protein n=1 Tax=Aegilops tauschii subsp. strangulata TaxID=200361 RepID=A0A453IRZ2_AEGTS
MFGRLADEEKYSTWLNLGTNICSLVSRNLMFGHAKLRDPLDVAGIFVYGCLRALSFQSVVSHWPQ